ncbi:hypothetical protein [Budvicia aquatica]|uniref:Uncharacterized protein n=2 Tax=Budvicia aquatica TaxID=82979 RepID=A0A484ZGK7_9GAMM|nr:hypothetical protein [Budvicia aquatica]VFS47138.1 Uncharacterised protein [Budvicia aquatica]
MENNDSLNSQDDEDFSLPTMWLVWAVVAVVVSIVMCVYNVSAMVLGASIWAKTLAVIVGAILGWIGAIIGQGIRNFAHPDIVFTHGGLFSLVGIKLFWLCGPQLIGLVFGVALGMALILN